MAQTTERNIVHCFSDYEEQKDHNLLTVDINNYLTSKTNVSARETLDFRLSYVSFNCYMEYSRHLLGLIKESSFTSIDALSSDIEIFFQLMLLLTRDYDFSFQLGDYGGHSLLKQFQRLEGRLSVSISNLIDEVIATILECGVQFPQQMTTSHKESVVRPLVFEFKTRPVITPGALTSNSSLSLLSESGVIKYKNNNRGGGDDDGNGVIQSNSSVSVSMCQVIIRQVPAGLHGAGQAAVGYIMWSSAVILSRW
jgi:hypothetical protein